MKNTFIVILAVVVLAIGVWVFLGIGKKAEAPAADTSKINIITPPSSQTDVAGNVNSYQPPVVVKEFAVDGKNFSFTPSKITVKKGDKVKITFNNTSGFHDFKIDEFGVATKQAQSPYQEVLEFTANKTGSFEYYCSVGTHRMMGMKGTLVVE